MSDVQKTIEAVWKAESTRLIAAIARVTRDVGVAEELAQDALITALEQWPEEGIPENPAAWLMTAAKRRAIDSLRRGQVLVQKHEEIARELEVQQQRLGEAMDQALEQVIDDDVLRLIFTACHPVLAVEGRIALTLRLICGLTTAEIARAFLVPEKTMGQRIFRAKKTLSEDRQTLVRHEELFLGKNLSLSKKLVRRCGWSPKGRVDGGKECSVSRL